MADTYYSIGLKVSEGQLPVPAQSGIKNPLEADALKGLYPRRLQPTVQKDSVSISRLAKEMATGIKTPTGSKGALRVETSNEANRKDADPRVALGQQKQAGETAKAIEVVSNPVPAGSQSAITPAQQTAAANGTRNGGFSTVA